LRNNCNQEVEQNNQYQILMNKPDEPTNENHITATKMAVSAAVVISFVASLI